jgi:hypothetical protein
MKPLFLQKGFAYYVGTMGVGFFPPWMFVVYCFVYTHQGIGLSASKLVIILLMALISGLFWGCTTWPLLLSRAKFR